MKELVKCGNPAIIGTVGAETRFIRTETFDAIVIEGVKYCGWCCRNPLPKKRRSYCSDECRESCNLYCAPQTQAGLAFLFNIRPRECSACKFNYQKAIDEANRSYLASMESYKWAFANKESLKKRILEGEIVFAVAAIMKGKCPQGRAPELDHIIPVALGGTTLGFDNLQIICEDCHRIKTRKDMEEIRSVKLNGKKATMEVEP